MSKTRVHSMRPQKHEQASDLAIYNLIDRLKVSKHWKDVFKRIHTCYLHNYFQGSTDNIHFWKTSPVVQQLNMGQKFNFFTSFNFWALLFGPLYYFVKLMYKKAIILGVILYFLAVYNQFTPYFAPLVMLYCALYANRDYFVKRVLNHPAVLSSPLIFSTDINEEYFLSVLKRSNHMGLAIITSVAVIVSSVWFLQDGFNLQREANIALTSVPQVCSSQEDCTEFINENLHKIGLSKSVEGQFIRNYKIACAYAVMGNKNSAIKFLDLTVRQNPNYLPAYLMMASYQFENQNYTEALANYKRAVEIAPRTKFLHYYLGRTYYKVGDFKNALIHLEIATQYSRNNPVFLETLAYTRIYLNDYDGAIKDLSKTMKLYDKQDSKKNALKIRSMERYIKSLQERNVTTIP